MGIAALGRIIEVVSGEEYVHFIETRILNPLGMKDTFFFPPDAKKDRIALVYKHDGGKLVRSGSEILAGDPAKYRAERSIPRRSSACTPPRPTCCTSTRCCSTAALPGQAVSFEAVDRDHDPGFHARREPLGMAGRHRDTG